MWTIVRFALLREFDYDAAFDTLAGCGFRCHRAPRRSDLRPYPAAVVGKSGLDAAVVTRALFEVLAMNGLDPVAVMAAPVDVAEAANSPCALARA